MVLLEAGRANNWGNAVSPCAGGQNLHVTVMVSFFDASWHRYCVICQGGKQGKCATHLVNLSISHHQIPQVAYGRPKVASFGPAVCHMSARPRCLASLVRHMLMFMSRKTDLRIRNTYHLIHRTCINMIWTIHSQELHS
jgi:hypothetical protein